MRMVLGFSEFGSQGKLLAEILQCPFEEVIIHCFPDGESKITLPENLPERIIICRSLNQPNAKLIELFLTADAARLAGVKHITLVAPYLCYMRQDIAFHPGEVVSQKIMGQMLAQHFDALFTIDPHLHRIDSLQQAVPLAEAVALAASVPMAAFLQQNFTQAVIVGPDVESEQWVAAVSKLNNWPYQIAAKERFGDAEVAVVLADFCYQNQHVVIVDDIASTGKTLEATALIILKSQPASLSVMVTHALFAGNAVSNLKKLGVDNIWSSDAIPHETNAFSIMPHMARFIKS